MPCSIAWTFDPAIPYPLSRDGSGQGGGEKNVAIRPEKGPPLIDGGPSKTRPGGDLAGALRATPPEGIQRGRCGARPEGI